MICSHTVSLRRHDELPIGPNILADTDIEIDQFWGPSRVREGPSSGTFPISLSSAPKHHLTRLFKISHSDSARAHIVAAAGDAGARVRRPGSRIWLSRRSGRRRQGWIRVAWIVFVLGVASSLVGAEHAAFIAKPDVASGLILKALASL